MYNPQQLNVAWTNEDTFKFIELYQNKPIIWNPKNKKHTDRNLVDEAWQCISEVMDIPVSVLKRKKKTLMTTFRFHYKKKQQTLRRYKPGSKHIYTPIWTFYEALETFLKGVYENKSCGRRKRSKRVRKQAEDDESWEQPQKESSNDTDSKKLSIPLLQRRKNDSLGIKKASREVVSAFHILNNIFKQKQRECSQQKQDECELYGRLLAKRLRQFSETEKLDIMYELDGLLINRCIRHLPDSPPCEIVMNENPNSASDSYASPSLSPTQSQKILRQYSPTKSLLVSPQSDPLHSSSNSHLSIQQEEYKKEIDVIIT